MVLLVGLFLEGVTIPFIGPLLSWHIAIGLALIPPVALKMASTIWRFAKYYLRSFAYRQAGPPPALLRLIGPGVTLSTVAVIATGVVVWAEGPRAVPLWGFAHKATFVIWFGLMALHVLGHILQAARVTAAEVGPPRIRRPVRGAAARLGLVAAVALAGVALGFAGEGIVTTWPAWAAWAGIHATSS